MFYWMKNTDCPWNHRPLGVVIALAGILLYQAASGAETGLKPAAVEFFETKIRPVLAQDCYECHRSGGKKKGGLALDYRQVLEQGGDSGKVIVPGDAKASLLIKAIQHKSDDLKMPKARAKLEEGVIADFEKWVNMGAPDPREGPPSEEQVAGDTDWKAVMNRRKAWWSFQPVKKPDLTALPQVGPGNNPVDRFIRAKLVENQLSPAPKADRRILVRRLSYALRGLPPTPEEIESFVSDKSDGAYERLVDKFLGSPRWGERWARHWMDWLRYADSHGSEGDPMIPYAWRYRDYLIRALNADVPYDQMVREHLAGDLLEKPRINRELGLNESALGIGHLRMVFHGYAPTDALDEQVRFTDDQINVVSKAFLALTVTCARCHNHKFDPISQKDFYAWYGIFVSCPPASIAVDAPDPGEEKRRETLANRKQEIKEMLADHWLKEAGAVAEKLKQPSAELRKAIENAKEPTSVLHPFFLLGRRDENTNSAKGPLSAWRSKIEETTDHQTARQYPKRWNLASSEGLTHWRQDGKGMVGASAAGAFAIAADGDSILTGVYPAGVYSHLTSSKDRGVLLSPKYQLDQKYDLWMRVMGEGGAVARYVVQNYPRDGSVFPVTKLNGAQWRWVKLGLDYWEGDRIYLEVTTAADQPVLADMETARSWFGLAEVVFTKTGEPGPPEQWEFARPVLAAFDERQPSSAVELAEGYANAVRDCVRAWRAGTVTDGQALFLDQVLKRGLLSNHRDEVPSVKPLLVSYRAEEAAIRSPTRAPGVIETEPMDQPLLVRGDHKQPSESVARRFLEAIDASPYGRSESGRRELAESLLRADNPLTMRVIVNRVWHHLFGRGIVATPDNFGRMGEAPSHPELLDYLAGWFVDHGYSIKALTRLIVTSETWQMSSEPPAGAVAKDPNNVLLAHFNVRRLEAEAIRDALLSVTGELKTDDMYGPAITGRTARRSVYVRVKRNELDPFLAAFDAPVPASANGKRDVTNVPGQSLTLLNDPFVMDLADHWANDLMKRAGSETAAQRIEAMFVRSLGRSPSTSELERAERFVAWAAAQRKEISAERTRVEETIKQAQARLEALSVAATQEALTQRNSNTNAIMPMAAWDFRKGLADRIGTLHGKAFGGASIGSSGLVLEGKTGYVETAPLKQTLKAKTLEAWVKLDNLDQQGGGVIKVQSLEGEVFDAIVIGEKQKGRWMAGSEGYQRTTEFGGPAETNGAPVHVAIVYAEDGTITAYRNGRLYGKSYKSNGPVTFGAGKSQVLFGSRQGDPARNQSLGGSILGARLYDRALTASEIETSTARDSNFVSEEELLVAMTASERQERGRLREELAKSEERLKSLNQTQGLSSEWADLGHALVNLKEFIYIQ